MKNNRQVIISLLIISLVVGGTTTLTRCTNNAEGMTKEQMVKRGEYLVTVASCNDCHSPKIMTLKGPIVDTTKLLSGHPEGSKLPPFDPKSTSPADWVHMSQDVTAFVGPWGISYAANITPDETTGIGAWTEEVFIKTLKTGKHLGQDGGRAILPPMPWYFINKMTDEDLKSVFAYLKSLPAIKNQVPGPVASPDAAKMMTAK